MSYPVDNSAIAEPPCMRELYRAVLTDETMPDPDLRFFRVESTWPTYARRYLDAYNSEAEPHETFVPTPHDVTTYLDTLRWTRGLGKRQRQIVHWRAHGYSLHLIADLLHAELEDIEQAHRETIAIVSSAATLDTQARSSVFSRRHHRA